MKPELIWALKVCETCLGTKGRLSAWEQAKGISFSSHRLPCVFLIDRPRPHLIEMTCSWQEAPTFQVDHLSAAKLSSVQFMKKFDGRSFNLRHKHIMWWWVQLTVDYTSVGKVGYFRVRRRLYKVHPQVVKCQKAIFVSMQVFSSSSKTPTFKCLLLFLYLTDYI